MEPVIQLVTVIANHSIQLVLSSILIYILILIIQYYKMKFFNDLDNSMNIDSLHNHPIFNRTENLLKQVDYTLDFDKGRSKLIQDIIYKKYEMSLKYFKKMVTEIESDDNNDLNLHDLHMKYKNKIEKDFSDLDNYEIRCEEEKEALKVAIKEFQKFQHHREEFIRGISLNIESSDFYGNNRVKLYALLNTYMGVFVDILHDAQLTLNNINGRISGKEYKGCKIKNLEEDENHD